MALSPYWNCVRLRCGFWSEKIRTASSSYQKTLAYNQRKTTACTRIGLWSHMTVANGHFRTPVKVPCNCNCNWPGLQFKATTFFFCCCQLPVYFRVPFQSVAQLHGFHQFGHSAEMADNDQEKQKKKALVVMVSDRDICDIEIESCETQQRVQINVVPTNTSNRTGAINKDNSK